MSHTCAALSSAAGKAGIAVIRLSGDDALAIASRVFRPACGGLLSEQPANRAVYGTVYDADGVKLDTGIAVCFHAPHSYTGEDTVEISCHGSPVGVSLVLGALFAAGAKPALPGEFTKRAFISGKLDLTQAEAVADLLDAENAVQLRLFSAQLDGVLGKQIKAVSDRITEMLAAVYAYIDYPDEDMSDLSDQQLAEGIGAALSALETLIGTYSSGVAVTKGVNTVIAGAPNTGKSTLFNLLAGFERAIVTDVAGTTRDVITESVQIHGVKLNISDTAGIHETQDTVEKLGVARSEQALNDCELLIAVFDGTKPYGSETEDFAARVGTLAAQKPVIAVINKCDIAAAENIAALRERLSQCGVSHVLTLSAMTGEGKAAFEDAVAALYPASGEALAAGAVLTNARQYAAVKSAAEHLRDALNAMQTLTRDMAGLDLEQALGSLCEADGRQVSAQVVDTIFSRFCVGK